MPASPREKGVSWKARLPAWKWARAVSNPNRIVATVFKIFVQIFVFQFLNLFLKRCYHFFTLF